MYEGRRRSRTQRTSLMDRYCFRLGQLAERDRAEVALRVSKENAEKAAEIARAASQAKTDFLAKMSHEIRTPMNGVLGMTDLLSRSELTDRQRKFVNIAQQSTKTLLNIINDILDFSRIEAGRLELDCTDFDVRSTVGDGIDLLAESAQNKGLEMAYVVSREVPQRLRGDPNRLRQIIFNLIGNGIKFTDRGEVVVRVDVDETTEESTVLSFEITDTGIGIPSEVEHRIMEPFEQADGTITRRFGGTGLGLAIAQQLIEMMGGEFSIDSALGKGSTFRFTARLRTPVAGHDQTSGQSFDLAGTKVLIVDDNATSREILHYYLSDWGMVTEKAADGQQALQMLRAATDHHQPFDLALLDMTMPGLSGVDVAQTIETDSELAGTRAIVLAPMGQQSNTTESTQSQKLTFLTKPVRESELQVQIGILMAASGEETIPPAEHPVAPQPAPYDKGTALDAKILLAEDNLVNQEVTKEHLIALSCRVDVVATGLEALKASEQTTYDLILMDCQMPDMDGFEATTMLRLREQQQNQKRRTPIIAVTANAFDGEYERCLEAGMDDYISKPFSQDDLYTTLKRWLNQHGSPGRDDGDMDATLQAAS